MEWKRLIGIVMFMVSSLETVFLPGAAHADGLSGYLQLDFSRSRSSEQDRFGETIRAETDSALQRYNLNFDRNLYPYLRFKAGGIFEKLDVESMFREEEFQTVTKRTNGYADLSISNPLFRAGAGYAERREKVDQQGSSPLILFRETTSASAGLARQEGRPTLDALLLRTETYDRERTSQNTVQDAFSLTSQYRPVKELDLRLSGGLNDVKDLLNDFETAGRNASGRFSYTDRFLQDRMSLNTTYTTSYQTLERMTGKAGDVQFQVFPLAGLASVDDIPSDGALNPLPALVDGDLLTGSGVNIGRLPSTLGDTQQRNLGLDFATAATVNTLMVWTDREIPVSVAAAYSWAIYVSSDNQTWSAGPPVTAQYGPFDSRFLLTFADVTARYVKAVTRPLSAAVPIPPGADVDTVFVSELQAFTRRTATSEDSRITRGTSQVFDLNTRTLLLQEPSLVHDLFLWNRRTSPGGPSQYVLSNGLSLTKQLSSIMTGGARIGREDANEKNGHRGTNLYGATLGIVPFSGLSHTLLFSGKRERVGDLANDSASLFLNNTAEFYRGISATLSGGVNRATSETGEESRGTIVNFGTTLVPLHTLTINLGYSDAVTRRWGTVTPGTSGTTTSQVSAAYTPVQNLYLFASIGDVSERNKPSNTVQNYAVSWSPFSGGSLQVTLPYTQTLRSADNARETSVAPSIRWMVNRSTTLTVSYQVLTNETALRLLRTETAYADLRFVF